MEKLHSYPAFPLAFHPKPSGQDTPPETIAKGPLSPMVVREFNNSLSSLVEDGFRDLTVPGIEYAPLRLDPREVRLLVLHPPGNTAEHVRCDLETHVLEDMPTFVAIKNARGYRKYEEPIEVDGKALCITTALERFLRYFRTTINQPTRIWVRYACVVEFDQNEQGAYWTREFSDFMYEQANTVLDMHEINNGLVESGYFEHVIDPTHRQWTKDWYASPENMILPRVCPIRLGTRPDLHKTTPDYQYMPLDMVANEIRIMCIMPAEDPSAPIVMHASHCPIKCEVDFTALSYRWGEEGDQEQIIINGQKSSIRKNLAEAIRVIRMTELVVPIWIDALCIDQKNVAERDRQVPRMGEIYDIAIRVFSYIGKPTDDTKAVLDFMDELYRHPRVRENEFNEFHFGPWDGGNTMKPDRLTRLCAGLYKLLTRQYFRRAWILQEVAYASNPTILLGRHQSISFDLLESAAHKLQDMMSRNHTLAGQMEDVDSSLVDIDAHMLSYSRKLFYFRHLTSYGTGAGLSFVNIDRKAPGFLEALVMVRDFESTDPRDKIFSVWNLARDKIGLDYKPEYRNSYEKVYTEFAKAWIKQQQTLDIIGAVEVTSRSHSFYNQVPSWVPDWSTCATTSCLVRKDSVPLTVMSMVDDQQGRMYSADAGMTRDLFDSPLFHFEDEVLHCTGIILDQIETILLDVTTIPNGTTILRFNPEANWRFRCWTSAIYFLLQARPFPMYKNIIRAACAMFHGDTTAAWPPRAECAPENIPTHDPYICQPKLSRHVRYYVGGYLPTEAWHVVKHVLRGRRPFVSRDGYMGLVPAYIADQGIDDARPWHLAVIAGCSVPVILRERDDGTYQLVGTCFVQGWMDGEWIKNVMWAENPTEFWGSVKESAQLVVS